MRPKVMRPCDWCAHRANNSAMLRGKSAGHGSGANLLCQWSLAGPLLISSHLCELARQATVSLQILRAQFQTELTIKFLKPLAPPSMPVGSATS